MKISRNASKTSIVLVLILVAGIVVGAPRQQGQEAQEKSVRAEDYLPDGEARNLILQGCVQCHELQNTVSQRKTATRWRRTVDEMIWRGAPLMSDEAEIIVKYLAAAFGPDQLKGDVPNSNVKPKPQDRKQRLR